MVASGVCHTDPHYRSVLSYGRGPYVLGHEGAGIVEETGPGVTGIRPGRPGGAQLPALRRVRALPGGTHRVLRRIAYRARLGELNAPGTRPDGA
nr:alcohol dehydrogenase catalytic domain-containing protein [Streptomyces sp. V3I7]